MKRLLALFLAFLLALSGLGEAHAQLSLTRAGKAKATAAAVQPLRATNNADYMSSTFYGLGGTDLQHKSRQARWIGAGDRSSLVLSFYNWILTAGGVQLGTNSYTLQEVYLENEAETQSVQVTFDGGSTTKTILAGDTDIKSDPILPSSFSLSSFARGSKWWIRIRLSVSTAGHSFVRGMDYNQFGPRGGTFPGWVGWAYDPAVNTTTGAISGTGTLSLGSGVGSGTPVPSVVVLGRFVSGDPRTWMLVGDSIADASADGTTGNGYAGFFSRALVNDTFDGNFGAGIGFGSSGAKASMWTAGSNVSKATAYWQYTTGGVDEFGANHFNLGGGAGDTLSTAQSTMQALWTMLRGAGIDTIIRTHILPRNTSSNSWTNLAGQTPVSSDYNTGGLAEQFNTWLATQIGPTGITSTVDFAAARDGSNAWAWVSTGASNYATSDGIHPSTPVHGFMATQLRTQMALYP